MKIKFQADNDLDEDILRAAKRLQPGMDFQRAPELDLLAGLIRSPYAILEEVTYFSFRCSLLLR